VKRDTHVVMYSGGVGSWMTAKRLIEERGKKGVVLLFADTLIEDFRLSIESKAINEKDMDWGACGWLDGVDQ
jgi:PP-loop superfamily ATP-utilizing enzyme